MIPEEVITIILHAKAEAMRLSDIEATVVGERYGRRRGHAGFLVTTGDLERRTRLEGRAAFARHAHQVVSGLGLRTATR